MPEVLMVMALTTMVAANGWQALTALRDERAGREAARGLVLDLRRVAQDARRLQRALAVEFDAAGSGSIRVLADGNGNGVTSADIAAGTDAPLQAWRPAFREGRAALRINRVLPDSDGLGTLPAGSTPVRLGIQSRLHFTPRGTGNAGSLYLTGPRGHAYAIRVLGSTQRIRVLCLGAADTWDGC
ncbi:MAG: hypothetical protein ACR2LU_03250 [Luteitalea sp.]|nr:hypothetical protein [Acidobacteriota bacterium]